MTSDSKTVFDMILDGEIPCHRIFEDEHVLAFLDIGPLSRGHALVIPKQRVAAVHELDEQHAAAIGRALPRIAKAISIATGCGDYNVLCNTGSTAGQEVMHVHFHIIPKTANAGLVKQWTPGALNADDAKQLVAAIQSQLGG